MVKEDNNKREEFVTKIGPILKQVLEEQKNIIKDITWKVCKISDYEAGEVIAKKIIEKNLL